ncbi:hypothetical protein [Hyphococcus sp.]|uniref:hypothetical protein n=1 Tax=Hyphococcus sp. TaxID=2038636 RepID=UPI003CCB9511
MKFLASLSVFQTVLLAFLCLRMMAVDARTDEVAQIALAAAAEQEAAERRMAHRNTQWTAQARAANAKPALSGEAQPGLNAEDIRAIFRDELAALPQGTTPVRTGAAAQAVSPSQVQRLQTQFAQELSYLRASGGGDAAISQVESVIAQLPPAERREALSELARTIASGDADARL